MFVSATLVVLLGALPASSAHADDKAQIKKDFDAWHAKTKAQFAQAWTAIQEAEASVQSSYDKGVKLAEGGKNKKATQALLKARSDLFNHKNGTFVHVNKGLSFKIALALAGIYDATDEEALLKREIVFMDNGRNWMAKDEEKIFLHHALQEVYRVWGVEERKEGRKRMKTKDRNRLKRIMAAVTIGPHTDILLKTSTTCARAGKKPTTQPKRPTLSPISTTSAAKATSVHTKTSTPPASRTSARGWRFSSSTARSPR